MKNRKEQDVWCLLGALKFTVEHSCIGLLFLCFRDIFEVWKKHSSQLSSSHCIRLLPHLKREKGELLQKEMGGFVHTVREKGELRQRIAFSSTPKISVVTEEYSSTVWNNGEQIVFLT